MISALSMAGWADIAQYVFALTGVAALGFAYAEIRSSRAAARRGRVYDYADAFNELDLLRASAKHEEQWPEWTVADLHAMSEVEQAEWMRVPNLVEEVAYLYNHKALDQDVAAELLGVYVEKLWQASEHLIKELRDADHRPKIFIEWQQMQTDTWKRRGVAAPLGVDPPANGPAQDIAGPVSRVKWLLSADYRRDARNNG